MNRVIWPVVFVCLIAIGLPNQRAAGESTIEANVAGLRQQLVSGLRVTRPDDLAFIDKVVTMVDDDELPLALVKATFQWTRQNPKAKSYPFFYFQRALREQAKKLGIDV
jgi:hypothetical protein